MKRTYIKWVILAITIAGLIIWFAIWLSHQKMI